MDKQVQLKIIKIIKEYPPKDGKFGPLYAVAAEVDIDGLKSDREYLKSPSKELLVAGWSGTADEKRWTGDNGEESVSYWIKKPKTGGGFGGGRVVNERSIHAQVALKCACECTPGADSNEILATADKFLEWIEARSK